MLDPLIGQTIDGRFEVRARLGQGGMGTVYRAWQRSVDREVAVKLMDPMFSADPTAVRRFEREAQLASKLSQPNTVSVIDFGKHSDGRLFIVMELIRGRTLHKIVSTEGAFSIDRAARITIQICDALDAAHRLGIIHRDLKLDNVMVLDDPPGRDLVKVLDFGLAKQVGELDPRATGSGIVVGTPRYIAPEVAVGGEMSPAADMYAVGVMLGELTIGKPLWHGDSLSDLLAQKMKPGDVLANVPVAVNALVRELISSKAHERPSAAAVRERLSLLASGMHPRVVIQPSEVAETRRVSAPTLDNRPVRRTRRYGTVGLVFAGLVLAALIVIGIVLPSSKATDKHDEPTPVGSAVPIGATEVSLIVVTNPQGAVVTVAGGEDIVRGQTKAHGERGSEREVTATWPEGGTQAATITFDYSRVVMMHRRGNPQFVHITDDPKRTDTMMILTGMTPAALAFNGRRIGTAPGVFAFAQSTTPLRIDANINGQVIELVYVPDRDRKIDLKTRSPAYVVTTCASCPNPDNAPTSHRFQIASSGADAEIEIGGAAIGKTPLEFDVADSGSAFPITAKLRGALIRFDVMPNGDHTFLVADE
ncbi:MAG: serine/threonine-protein kinase [Kofleriaceae bacterium]